MMTKPVTTPQAPPATNGSGMQRPSSPLNTPRAPRRKGFFARMFAPRPVKAGESFGAPGQGPSLAISVVTVFALLAIWVAITSSGMIKPLFLPGPRAIVEKFIQVSTEGFAGSTLWQHTLASLYRVFGAFALACVTAIPVGILMGVSRIGRGVFDPPIEFYRPLPPLAYLPLVIIWFGIGEFSKVFLIYLAIFAPLAIAARAGVRSVSMEQIHAAYSMGASPRQIVMHVIVKSALPEIFTGMRIGIGVGWTTLVAAEMVAASSGLGFMVLNAAEFLASDIVIMGIIVIGFFAFGFDLIMRYLERVLVPWKGKV
ncbi:binding-protein-dependent transport system inner membrane protein [Pandoraea sputorum]|uniref:Binding-protein-dependent transport system inner membrane protein n=2 Tax=Pandoraea sputorum TaxID=93222 RepID=A0A5E5AW34_9BURK|nr:binding-protein-dependent transport system inner membrane protein [Pandoraea sputorum]